MNELLFTLLLIVIRRLGPPNRDREAAAAGAVLGLVRRKRAFEASLLKCGRTK